MSTDGETAPLVSETALEDALAAARNGELASTDFLHHLTEASVHILVNEAAAREEQPEDVEPLVLLDDDEQAMLAVFTGRSRCRLMSTRFPEFSLALEVPFSWVVSNCQAPMGIVINPGWSIGATLPSAAVVRMRAE